MPFIFPTRFLCSREPNACFTPVNHRLQLHPFIFSHTLFTVYSSLIHDPLSHFLLTSSHLPLSSSHLPFSSSSLSSHLPTFHSHPPSFPLIFPPSILILLPFLSSSHLSFSSFSLSSHLHTLHSHISPISTLIFPPFLSPSLLSHFPSHLLPFRIIFPHSILILTLASPPLSSYHLFTHICTPITFPTFPGHLPFPLLYSYPLS